VLIVDVTHSWFDDARFMLAVKVRPEGANLNQSASAMSRQTLADVIEKSHIDSQESLKDFIHNENTNLDLRINETISRGLKDMLIKIFGIIVGTVGVAVTILKLFP
jgi:hypothetical protein